MPLTAVGASVAGTGGFASMSPSVSERGFRWNLTAADLKISALQLSHLAD